MPDLSHLLKLLPAARAGATAARRWWSRRRIVKSVLSSGEMPDPLAKELEEALNRLGGGRPGDPFWRRARSRLDRWSMGPGVPRGATEQQILQDEQARADLIELAKAKVLGRDAPEARKRLEKLLDAAESRQPTANAADGRPDRIASAMVASYRQAIPAEAQGVVEEFRARLDYLGPGADPVVGREHTRRVTELLDGIVKDRCLPALQAARRIRDLLADVEEGTLGGADARTKNAVRYWAARLLAEDRGTVAAARELLAVLPRSHADFDVVIVEARIAETEGDHNRALDLLRDPDYADRRSSYLAALARIGGKDDALTWFDSTGDDHPPDFLTAPGWRTWAICMAEAERWEEATTRLAEFEGHWQSDTAFPLTEGILNAAMLLPAGERSRALKDVPIYPGITPSHPPEAGVYAARARKCFTAVQDYPGVAGNPDLSEFVDTWQLWLRLMDPEPARSSAARTEAGKKITDGPAGFALVPLVWAFGIEFDATTVRTRLAEQRGAGQFSSVEWAAECLSNQRSMPPRDFVRYLERHWTRLTRIMPEPFSAELKIRALVADGQPARARDSLERAREVVGSGASRSIELWIETNEGEDRRSELEALYPETNQLSDLRALIHYLQEAGDQDALPAWLAVLFERERTVQNAVRLVVQQVASEQTTPQDLLEFLDVNEDLVKRSPDLRAARASALFGAGDYGKAREVNDALREDRRFVSDDMLAIELAVLSGDWERVPGILDRVWSVRDSCHADTLIHLAYFAADHPETLDRALELGRLATRKRPNAPQILMGAFELFVRSGRDAEADPSWLGTALKQSSEETGPLWEMSIRSVVEELMPDRQRVLARMNRQVQRGKLPLSVAAVASHTSLAHVFLHSPEENAAAGGLERGIIPIVAGGRPALDLSGIKTVGLDVTSLMVLAHLGVLEKVLEGFPRIALSPVIFAFLYTERRRTQFHQPVVLREATHLIELRRRDRIRPADVSGLEDEEKDGLSDEVGSENAALIRAARREKGFLVAKLPIYRPDSLMEREAKTAEFGDLLVSTPTLLHTLSQAGQVSAADQRKMEGLGTGTDPHGAKLGSSLLKAPIFLATSTLSDLRRADLLDAATSVGLDLRLHPRVFAQAESLVKEGEIAERLRERIHGIRDALRSGIEAGKVVLLPRRPIDTRTGGEPPEGFESTALLLEAAGECDAVCIDDRALNRLRGIAGPDGVTPVASVLDVLRTLRTQGVIGPEEYGAARHRLREGGFAFVAPEADEVATLVTQASVQDGQLTESPELRVLRQTAARLEDVELAVADDVREFAAETMLAITQALRSLWEDPEVPPDEVEPRASYLWWQMADFVLGRAELLGRRANAGVRGAGLRHSIEAALHPLVGVPPEVTARYASWLENSVLSVLRPVHRTIIKEACDAAVSTMDSTEKASTLLGHLFLKQLPESLRNGVLLQHPDFAERCGFRLQQSISIDDVVGVEVPVLFKAVRRAFRTGKPVAVAGTEGAERLSIAADVRSGEVVVTWDESGRARGARISTLGILAHSKEVRTRALDEAQRRYGPTFDLSPFVRAAQQRALRTKQASVVLEEGARGVARRQKDLSDKLRAGGGLTIEHFVPSVVSYYERFCGPDPDGKELEQYVPDVLIPYRKTLLERDLAEGLQICLLGALRDDLNPGEWACKADREKVWGVLSSGLPTRTPFWLLGALDTALYHLEDPRFRDFAAEAVDMLLDRNLKHDQEPDTYQVFGVVKEVIRTGVASIEGFYGHPPYWRRMCALMQAGLICHLTPSSVGRVNLAGLVDWTKKNQSAAAYFTEVAGLRDDPVRLPEPTDVVLIHAEVLARLYRMQKRHEADGRVLPRGEKIAAKLAASGLLGPEMTTGFPGPLDRHVLPGQPVGLEVAQHFEGVRAEKGEKEYLSALAVLSMHFRLDADTMQRVHRNVSTSLAGPLDEGARRAERASFPSVVMIAVSQRNVSLAKAVGDALVRYSGAAKRPETVGEVVGLLCQLAPAIEADDQRASWLQERFKRVAETLPVAVLPDCLHVLRALDVVLPCDAWFHTDAKRVARARTA